MDTAAEVYRGYGIWLGRDEAGRWQSTIRRLERASLIEDEDISTLGPFLTAELACREAQWAIDLREA